MRRWAARLAQIATLALFAANVAIPRPGFFVHSHVGGEREHVHPDDGSLLDLFAHHHEHAGQVVDTGDPDIDRELAEALGEGYHHHVHRHDGGTEVPSLEVPDPAAGTAHWHVQSPFQRAVEARSASLGGLAILPRAPVLEPTFPATPPAARSRARSPPSA